MLSIIYYFGVLFYPAFPFMGLNWCSKDRGGENGSWRKRGIQHDPNEQVLIGNGAEWICRSVLYRLDCIMLIHQIKMVVGQALTFHYLTAHPLSQAPRFLNVL